MRKAVFAVITGACFFTIVAVALAVTNTVSYTSTVKEKTKPKPGKPANTGYTGTLDVGTTDGTQPDGASSNEIFLAKGYIANGKFFPSCKQSDIDGKTTVPAKCKKAVIGITQFAKDQLGDVVYLELPEVGAEVKRGQPFGVVESTKAVSELFAPLTGKVTKVNQELVDAPEGINDSPYEKGWMIEIELSQPDEVAQLLSATQYQELLAAAER